MLTDRYVYSMYAAFSARGIDLPFLKTINRSVPLPDLTVLLDLPAEHARNRVAHRDGGVTKFEEQSLEFMEAFRRGFLTLQDETVLVLDARMDAKAIHAAVLERCTPFLYESASRGPAPAHAHAETP